MEKQVRDAWVKALRGGKRKQGTGHLRHDTTHCCLGVLARDALKMNLDRYPSASQSARIYSAVTDALGNFERVENFFRMNDSKKMTFAQIADYIEANY